VPGSAATLFAVVLLLSAFYPATALAQTYRCVGKDGKKYYSSTVPRQCLGEPIELLNPQGTVIRRMDPEGDAKARAAKEAEAAHQRELDAATKESRRRNRALLATYTSEKDIEDARERALAENTKSIKEIEGRIAEIHKRQAGYAKEMQFYQDTSKGAGKGPAKAGPKPPAKLSNDIHNAEVDLRAQQELLESKKNDSEHINAKYDDYRKRFIAITRGR
jgi:hypothetical protein